MSIAEEIKQLKELLDSGVLTPDEFEGVKRNILGPLPSRAVAQIASLDFVGTWRVLAGGMAPDDVWEFTLYSDGRVEGKTSCLTDGFNKDGWISAFYCKNILGVYKMTGVWMLEGSNLLINVRAGTKVGHVLNKGLRESGSVFNGAFHVVSVGRNELVVRDTQSNEELKLVRLGV